MEKKESQKGEKIGKMGLSICIFFLHFFCFFDLLCFAFILLFLLFSRQKAKINKSKNKANLESKINAKKMQMDKPIFSNFSPF